MLIKLIRSSNPFRSISINNINFNRTIKRSLGYRRGLRTSRSNKSIIRKPSSDDQILLLEDIEDNIENFQEEQPELIEEEESTPWEDYDVNLKTYNQVAIFDIDKDITLNEIEEALYDFELTKYDIEFFTFENEYEVTKNAVIYLPDDDIYRKILSWNAEKPGALIKNKRYILQPFSENNKYRTLIFDKSQLESSHKFLSVKFNVSPSDVTTLDCYRNANYYRKSAITLPSHKIASDVWLTLKYHPSFQFETTWKKIDIPIHENTEKLKTELMGIAHKIYPKVYEDSLNKYGGMKNEHDISFNETYDKYSYYNMLYKHFEKVLYIAGNDKKKACKLMGITMKKFVYEYEKLKGLGFEFKE